MVAGNRLEHLTIKLWEQNRVNVKKLLTNINNLNYTEATWDKNNVISYKSVLFNWFNKKLGWEVFERKKEQSKGQIK